MLPGHLSPQRSGILQVTPVSFLFRPVAPSSSFLWGRGVSLLPFQRKGVIRGFPRPPQSIAPTVALPRLHFCSNPGEGRTLTLRFGCFVLLTFQQFVLTQGKLDSATALGVCRPQGQLWEPLSCSLPTGRAVPSCSCGHCACVLRDFQAHSHWEVPRGQGLLPAGLPS